MYYGKLQEKRLFQGAFDPDVLLFAHGGVELLHQLVEAFQLIAVVIGPDRDGGGQLASAAGSAAQRHGGAQQQTDGRTKDSFHTKFSYMVSYFAIDFK